MAFFLEHKDQEDKARHNQQANNENSTEKKRAIDG
jgi:hypothetical protein